MAKEKKEAANVQTPAVKGKTPVIQKTENETEAEMIARIKSGNGNSDEYEDRFGKVFPK